MLHDRAGLHHESIGLDCVVGVLLGHGRHFLQTGGGFFEAGGLFGGTFGQRLGGTGNLTGSIFNLFRGLAEQVDDPLERFKNGTAGSEGEHADGQRRGNTHGQKDRNGLFDGLLNLFGHLHCFFFFVADNLPLGVGNLLLFFYGLQGCRDVRFESLLEGIDFPPHGVETLGSAAAVAGFSGPNQFIRRSRLFEDLAGFAFPGFKFRQKFIVKPPGLLRVKRSRGLFHPALRLLNILNVGGIGGLQFFRF